MLFSGKWIFTKWRIKLSRIRLTHHLPVKDWFKNSKTNTAIYTSQPSSSCKFYRNRGSSRIIFFFNINLIQIQKLQYAEISMTKHILVKIAENTPEATIWTIKESFEFPNPSILFRTESDKRFSVVGVKFSL